VRLIAAAFAIGSPACASHCRMRCITAASRPAIGG